jgi:16S rRNA C967 or C1407 C5-methylase (RsmB/RsmF family)
MKLTAAVVKEIIQMLKENLYEQAHENRKISEILYKAADNFDDLNPEWFVDHLQDKFGEDEEEE